MARGGYRPGAGRPKGSTIKLAVEVRRAAHKAGVTPLEYMLAVMNDPDADPNRRDRMAIAALPFVHVRATERQLGKKEQARLAAFSPDLSTPIGRLMARRAARLAANGGDHD